MRDLKTTYTLPSVDMAEDIARLHVTSWREAYAGIVPAEILANVDMAERVSRWRSYLSTDGFPTYLARVDDEPAGFIRAGALKEPLLEGADGHIFALYVLQRYCRMGLGRRLMGLAARQWIALDGRAFSVGVLNANSSARAFYEALGARFIRTDSYDWDGHNLPESLYLFENLEELSRFA